MNDFTYSEQLIINRIRDIWGISEAKKNSWSITIRNKYFYVRLEFIDGKEEKIVDVMYVEVNSKYRLKGIFTSLVEELKNMCDVIVFSGVVSKASYRSMLKFGAKKVVVGEDSQKYLLHDDSVINSDWEHYEKNYGSYYLK